MLERAHQPNNNKQGLCVNIALKHLYWKIKYIKTLYNISITIDFSSYL